VLAPDSGALSILPRVDPFNQEPRSTCHGPKTATVSAPTPEGLRSRKRSRRTVPIFRAPRPLPPESALSPRRMRRSPSRQTDRERLHPGFTHSWTTCLPTARTEAIARPAAAAPSVAERNCRLAPGADMARLQRENLHAVSACPRPPSQSTARSSGCLPRIGPVRPAEAGRPSPPLARPQVNTPGGGTQEDRARQPPRRYSPAELVRRFSGASAVACNSRTAPRLRWLSHDRPAPRSRDRRPRRRLDRLVPDHLRSKAHAGHHIKRLPAGVVGLYGQGPVLSDVDIPAARDGLVGRDGQAGAAELPPVGLKKPTSPPWLSPKTL
jgi:hypothetical protein